MCAVVEVNTVEVDTVKKFKYLGLVLRRSDFP